MVVDWKRRLFTRYSPDKECSQPETEIASHILNSHFLSLCFFLVFLLVSLFVFLSSIILIFPWRFNIVYIPCLFYIQWYHDHNVVTKSYSEISLQHHLSAYRMSMSSTFSSIPENVCCLIYFSLHTLILSEHNL